VSLWVNGKSDGRLTAENAERIAKAVKELGYVPNRAAQKLALGSSQSVSFLFPGALYGDFIASVVDGVSSHLGPDWEVAFVDAKPSAGGEAHRRSSGRCARTLPVSSFPHRRSSSSMASSASRFPPS